MSKRITDPKTKQPKNLIASRLQDISNEFDKIVTSEHPSESSELKHVKQVRKRDGTLQPVSFDKVRDRIMKLSDDLTVEPIELAQEVISCIYDTIETKELDELAARKAHNRCFIHPDWDRLASRLSVSNHQKETSGVFSEVIFELHKNNLVCDDVLEFVKKYETELNDVIDYKRDYALDYTGFQYFLKIYADRTIEFDENGNEIQGPIIERFQDLLMKVSLGIHREGFDIDSAIETYQFYSCLLFTHASPTIFNAAKEKSQCSSCFLLAMKEEPEWPYDSITKIYETLSDCAKISKLAGGIGVSISNVRGKGTIIHSVGRPSSGIVPMCKVYNETARYVDQGRRRKGAFAIYLEPFHPDIIDFLQLKKDDGASEDLRAKDLFYALWVPDLFMKRCETNEVWSLIDPSVCPELYQTNSEEFEEHYLRCEKEKKYVRQMPARKLLYEICVAQVETGTPYMLFKDHANRKSNQKNLGTIRQSNLCVSGDTRILTASGYKPIIDLKDQSVNVWNGFEWSNTTVKKTGTDQELMRIEFSNGSVLKCTPYHKFYINISLYEGNDHLSAFKDETKTKMVEAKELNLNDRLIQHKLPTSNVCQDFVTVTGIRYLPELEDTYCFTESKLGLGTFEGIVTGQCAEIMEYTDSNEQAVCFTEDTEIITRNGIKKIVDCDGEDVLSMFSDEACTYENQHFEKAKLVCNGLKEVYEISVEGHGTFNATGNHPILVRTGRNNNTKTNTYVWKKVQELKENDLTVVPNSDPLPGYDIDIMENQDIEYQTGGWMLGDGWMSETGWGVCFGPQEKETSTIVIEQMNKWHASCPVLPCGHKKNVNTYVQPNGVINWQSSKTSLKDLLIDKFGFKEMNSKVKYLSNKIKTASPKQLANFISAYFSADGCVCRHEKNNKQKVVVQLSSASETLLLDCQKVLKLFGIHSRVRFGEVKTRPGRFQGTLAIHGLQNLTRFQKSINFILSPEKQEKLALFIKEFKTLYARDSTVAKVKSIKKCKRYQKVYDLTLGSSHNFIANNIVVHNCNLSSICLPRYIDVDPKTNKPEFNFNLLYESAKILTRNLNKVIDINFYPNEETKRSNFLHRPVGIGIQGLADTFCKMRYPFESEEAMKLNSEIAETIYFGALDASCELAEEDEPYESYEGSPLSEGKFQFDLWGDSSVSESLNWDWEGLKQRIADNGVRNSLLVALMPTASTSFLMGCTESFEPISSNYYVSGGIVGTFKRVNKHLIQDMIDREMWTNEMRNLIVANNGSVQNLGLPDDIESLYKTVWEIPQKCLIDLSAERGRFVCQSQSFNVYLLGAKEDTDMVKQTKQQKLDQSIVSKLSSLHMYTWKKGLKTGMYYLRTKPAKDPIKSTIDPKLMRPKKEVREEEEPKPQKDVDQMDEADLEEQARICRRDNKEDCMMCGS